MERRRNDKPVMRFATLALAAFTAILLCACAPYPKVPLAPPLAYAEGEKALARGELAEAEKLFRAYLASDGTSYRARAMYQLARTQYQMEDYVGAKLTLDDLETEFPTSDYRQVAALRGDIAYALGRPVDAIVLWAKAFEKSNPKEKDALRPRIGEAMRSLDPDQAKELAAVVTEPEIYEMAIDRLAVSTGQAPGDHAAPAAPAASGAPDQVADEEVEQAGALGEVAVENRADPAVEQVAPPAAPPVIEAEESPDSDAAAAHAEGVEPGVHIGPRIAALLPLTGAGRDAGRGALASMRNAIDPATLLVRDTGSDPAVGVQLLRELSADRDVIAVLGPMLPAVIEAVRRDPAAQDLPILPLPIGGSAASQARSPGDTAHALAAHAVNVLHAKRIGILAPAAANAAPFERAVTALGATVVGTHIYDGAALDLNAALVAVQGWIDGGGIDAVYVADVAPRAIQLAKAARATAPQVALLGDAGWNDAGALAADAPAIEGAVIAGAPAAPSAAAAPTSPNETIERAAEALQRAIALGQTGRSETRTLLASIAGGQVDSPPQTVLLRIVGGRPVAIQ